MCSYILLLASNDLKWKTIGMLHLFCGGEILDKLNKLIKKFINKETILYLIFGVLTTILNIAICGLLYDILHWDVIIATVIAWIAAVIFAFITNKIFVQIF